MAPWFRKFFRIGPWSQNHSKLAALSNRRAAELEIELLRTVDQTLRKLNSAMKVPLLLTICILLDQLDRHYHQGQWLKNPQGNIMVCT
jgi:hypothetical protein